MIDDVLLQGDHQGILHAYDVSEETGCEKEETKIADIQAAPPQLWEASLGWRIESTPAVWNGTIFLGDRNGRFYALR